MPCILDVPVSWHISVISFFSSITFLPLLRFFLPPFRGGLQNYRLLELQKSFFFSLKDVDSGILNRINLFALQFLSVCPEFCIGFRSDSDF